MLRRDEHKEQMWQKKQSHKKLYRLSPFAEGGSALAEEDVTKRIHTSSTAESSRSSNTSAPSMKFGTAGSANHRPVHEQKTIWKQKSHGTTGAKEVEVGKATISQTEVRMRMIETVSKGLATMESHAEFETELIEHFGYLVKMPLLKTDRFDSSEGDYAREWATWERKLREVMLGNAEYLNSIQVPFEYAVKQVLEQLRAIAKGDYKTPSTKKKIGPVIFAAVNLPVEEIHDLLGNLAQSNPMVEAFIKDKNLENSLKKAHMTLAHKRSHGVIKVCKYAQFAQKYVLVEITALLFSDKLAALEAHPGSVGGEKVIAKNTWPHVTLWNTEGIVAKEAKTLPQLLLEGKATGIEIKPPATVVGTV
ncbi:hypothetical protein RJ639_041583 [Escallonia herrerae]|uniref:Uncharacterized protein n=1 Tax=Escallonia herrerae TaxID=1293975 RepID=A0AA88WGP4_9ASTE|nr:hypothetical protein RJ639_041583 [Escallonia herrerae]